MLNRSTSASAKRPVLAFSSPISAAASGGVPSFPSAPANCAVPATAAVRPSLYAWTFAVAPAAEVNFSSTAVVASPALAAKVIVAEGLPPPASTDSLPPSTVTVAPLNAGLSAAAARMADSSTPRVAASVAGFEPNLAMKRPVGPDGDVHFRVGGGERGEGGEIARLRAVAERHGRARGGHAGQLRPRVGIVHDRGNEVGLRAVHREVAEDLLVCQHSGATDHGELGDGQVELARGRAGRVHRSPEVVAPRALADRDDGERRSAARGCREDRSCLSQRRRRP